MSPGDGAGLGTEEGPVIGCGGLFISPSFLVLHEGGGVNLQEETQNLISQEQSVICANTLTKTMSVATNMRGTECFGVAASAPARAWRAR